MSTTDLVEIFVRAGLGRPNKSLVHVDGTTSLVYYVDDDDDRFVEVRSSARTSRQQRDQYLCVARNGDEAKVAVLVGAEVVRDWVFRVLISMASRVWTLSAPEEATT